MQYLIIQDPLRFPIHMAQTVIRGNGLILSIYWQNQAKNRRYYPEVFKAEL